MRPERRPVRTLVVDDEPLARRRLRAMLATRSDLEIVGEAASGTAAVRAIRELAPDLLLLDIQMPGKDGFAVLEEIAADCPVTIFITAHDEHAVRAFDVQAIDYVLKPVSEERLYRAIDRALSRFADRRRGDLSTEVSRLLAAVEGSRRDGRIAIKSERGVRLLPVVDIHWIEADADLVRIHTARSAFTHRATMAEMEAHLPPATFIRVHRSAIVNVNAIAEIQPLFKGDYLIVLSSGAEVRSGRTYREQIQKVVYRLRPT